MIKHRVIVNGASGKMGHLACLTLEAHPAFELVARLGRSDDLANAIAATSAEIVIDLTRSDSVYANSLTIIQHGASPVIGTSGLQPLQIEELRSQCESRHLGGIIIPNFSISAVLMMQFSALAARYLPDVEIVEAHHPQKADAPSGTALKTAELIAGARTKARSRSDCTALIPGALGALCHEVPVHSIRLPGVLAEQSVVFGQTGETLSITHRTIDRVSFMPGLVLACQRVQSLSTLCYGLEHLLDEF
jgi:4-hydroxy-tetrahydrodipicolinate reductase